MYSQQHRRLKGRGAYTVESSTPVGSSSPLLSTIDERALQHPLAL